MKKLLIILLFLTGAAPLVLRKYYLIQQSKTWNDSQTYCRATYTDLATIESDADMLKLQNEALKQQFSSDAWFGLHKELHDWRWSSSNGPPGTVNKWANGEPDNKQYQEECGFMDDSGTWGDAACALSWPFLCYDGTKTGSGKYVYISTSKTWFDAQSYCRLHYTDLAIIRDPTENSLLGILFTWMTWIDLFRTTWKWLDQTNLANITWKSGQPDNSLSLEDCGYLSNFQAGDARCSDLKPFFCHGIITGQKQILKFKVRSDQDVNDPVVQAALLEKIQQKLKELGMEQNITLKWREQADGVVFHKIKNDTIVE
ncbi:putative C-type lectin domain family 20 member A [Trichomycterus rosablanca]|uniref:putative C-type lectin domain family 20 member A n=1 Tax=Trichomycterus rosablanca TaxID=2290929 RepID=UPI002F353979